MNQTKSLAYEPYLPAVLSLLLFGVYVSTACPTIYMGDSGELTAAAFSLGIPHNSGYPLYALLGRLFCFLPLGHIAFRVNLMSAIFAVLTVWVVYSLILEMTASRVSAFAGAFFLAFTQILWSQAVCAEVYALHAFFVALLMRLLWSWDGKRTLFRLGLFAFITGVSFGNHMQTVMLAPAVFFIILSGDHKMLLSPKNFLALTAMLVLALSVYLYLPIRTDAGAAIHWGDPNTLDRFLAHVTARAHRSGYVLNKDVAEYASRAKEILWYVMSQFGLALPLAVWGWIKLPSVRWKAFFALIVVFDGIYGVFLNIISLEITPLGFSSCIALAVLLGIGADALLNALTGRVSVGKATRRTVRTALCLVPAIPLAFNYGICDQSRNYTSYEQALNIFRTVDHGATLFLDGDNNIFPVTYARIVEAMREDVTLYDRHNLLFRMSPPAPHDKGEWNRWEQLKPLVKKSVERAPENNFFAVFDPSMIPVPDRFHVVPYGILYRALPARDARHPESQTAVWSRYMTESLYDLFQRDFMTRQVSAYFHFARGKSLLLGGQTADGLKRFELASRTGYNDTMIHSDMGIFLTNRGFFAEARHELEKALLYHEDLAGVYNNWGYYYDRLGDYDRAAVSYQKSIELRPDNYGYYNNLGVALYRASQKEEARITFEKSLNMEPDQPDLKRFLKQKGLLL